MSCYLIFLQFVYFAFYRCLATSESLKPPILTVYEDIKRSCKVKSLLRAEQCNISGINMTTDFNNIICKRQLSKNSYYCQTVFCTIPQVRDYKRLDYRASCRRVTDINALCDNFCQEEMKILLQNYFPTDFDEDHELIFCPDGLFYCDKMTKTHFTDYSLKNFEFYKENEMDVVIPYGLWNKGEPVLDFIRRNDTRVVQTIPSNAEGVRLQMPEGTSENPMKSSGVQEIEEIEEIPKNQSQEEDENSSNETNIVSDDQEENNLTNAQSDWSRTLEEGEFLIPVANVTEPKNSKTSRFDSLLRSAVQSFDGFRLKEILNVGYIAYFVVAFWILLMVVCVAVLGSKYFKMCCFRKKREMIEEQESIELS